MAVLDDSDGAQERFVDHFAGRPGVRKKKAFGRDALTINFKIFAILRLGELVVKLPVDVGTPLVDSGEAIIFEPKPGRPMRQWYVLGADLDEARWIELAEASFEFVVKEQEKAG
jgi:hypothetical protein